MNGIAAITIQDQEVLLKFGLPAVRRIIERTAKGDLISDGIYNELGIAHILYAGYKNGCMLEDKPEQFEFQDFYNLVEDYTLGEDEKGQIMKAVTAFAESKFIERAAAKGRELKEEEEKKSSTGMKSSPSSAENSAIPQENIIE